jgi:hypothetical protein
MLETSDLLEQILAAQKRWEGSEAEKAWEKWLARASRPFSWQEMAHAAFRKQLASKEKDRPEGRPLKDCQPTRQKGSTAAA